MAKRAIRVAGGVWSGNVDHDGRAEVKYVYGDIGNRDMCVCVLQVFCAPAVGTHAGEDSLESRQESCCGRGDDESKIRRWDGATAGCSGRAGWDVGMQR